jgi:hypothetical protein
MVGNFFTKALQGKKFQRFWNDIQGCYTHYGNFRIARIVLKSDQKSGQILQSGNEGASRHLHPRIVSIRGNLPGL